MATLLTVVGQRKFLEAEVTGRKVEFSEYALGDGIGVTEGQTSLTSEKFRHPINDLKVVEDGILIECHVPKEAEGFTIREVGVYDAKGDLIVVSDYPETDRLVTEEADTLIIQVVIGISNTESATIKVDASELMASQQSVNLALEESKRYTDAKVGDVDFSEIEEKIKKLETEDKRLHALIAENAEALQAIDAEGLKEQGELAEERGLIAEERGEVARVKGNLAEASADKADRASERANAVASELESYGHVGEWQAGSYKKNQEVLHEGSTYRAMKDTEEEPPSNDWQLIARKGADGAGSVVTVNGKSPDEDGNVELDELASKEYVDNKIGDVDLSALETKEDATEKFNKVERALEEHESLKGSLSGSGHVLLSNHTTSSSSVSDGVAATPLAVKTVNDKVDEHAEKIASSSELGHVRVGRGLAIDEEGKLSVKNYPVIYGVEIDDDNPDPFGRVKYIADSEGFEPLYTGDGNVNLGSWADKFPVNKVKIVLLKDGEVVEELDKDDHTKTVDGRTVDITSGDSGDVMVGIPLTYWKFERVGSKLRIYVSEHEIDESYKAYAHSRDGVVQDDYLYIGAYKGNVQDGKLRSLHDVLSTGNKTIGEFRNYAEANGEGWLQQNWSAMTLMQIFTVLLTKSTDSQSSLGVGYVSNNNSYIKNGGTTKKGLFYGEQTGKKQMKFLGLEDFYGNRYEWVDGLVRKNDKFWVNTSNKNYNNDADEYNDAGNAPDFNDYIKTIKGSTDTGFIPSTKGGSLSTYYCDYYYYNTGHRVAYFGGYRSALGGGARAGALLLGVEDEPSDSYAFQGARLLYLKGGN